MISTDEENLFAPDSVEACYAKAMSGDLSAIDTLVDWALMILSNRFNASATDKTAVDTHKQRSESAYMIDAAIASVAQKEQGYIKTYMQSLVSSESPDVLRVHHISFGEFIVDGQQLTSQLYLDLFRRLRQVSGV